MCMHQILSQMTRVREPRKDRSDSFLIVCFWAFSSPVSMLAKPQFWVLLDQRLGAELLSVFLFGSALHRCTASLLSWSLLISRSMSLLTSLYHCSTEINSSQRAVSMSKYFFKNGLYRRLLESGSV